MPHEGGERRRSGDPRHEQRLPRAPRRTPTRRTPPRAAATPSRPTNTVTVASATSTPVMRPRRLVRLAVAPVLAEERQQHRPGHVEGGQERRQPGARRTGPWWPSCRRPRAARPSTRSRRAAGRPASAREPIRNVQNVIGIVFRRPPISLMLFECTAWITAPDPRNSSALKNAWVNRWKKAPSGRPDPSTCRRPCRRAG